MAYPIQSRPDGSYLMSDGTVAYMSVPFNEGSSSPPPSLPSSGEDTSNPDFKIPAVPSAQTITLDKSLFKMPDLNSYVSDAFKALVPYYQKILTEVQGDVDRAKSRLEQDYATGVRYTTEDVSRETGYQQEDLKSQLESLGLQFPRETEQLADTLNKRGIAVSQDPTTGKAVGPTDKSAGGRAGYEMGLLTEDQKLRKEAVERTAQRSIADIGIKGTRNIEQAGLTKTRGEEDVVRGQQKTQEELQQEQEQKALQMGQIKQSEVLGKQQMDLNQKLLERQMNEYKGIPTAVTFGT